MSYSLSTIAEQKLATCDERLQKIVRIALKVIPLTVTVGHRGEDEQHQAFETGHSKLDWPESLHNSDPSKAVDCAPLPIDWNNKQAFIYMSGVLLGAAASLDIPVRLGCDWNMDGNPENDSFKDLGHMELL